ncbi:STAS domain-containing protein [Actinophytocola sp. KF-1]
MHETVRLPIATVRTEELDGAAVVEVTGDVDMSNAAELRAALTAALDSGPAVVDLTGTTFFCSAGINVLVNAAILARDHEVRLAVQAAHGAVLRPLQLAGVHDMLTICPTREAALAAVLR